MIFIHGKDCAVANVEAKTNEAKNYLQGSLKINVLKIFKTVFSLVT